MLIEATKACVVPCSREVSDGGGVICVRDRLVTFNGARFYGVCRILRLIGCLSGYRNTGLKLIVNYSVVAVVTSNCTEGLLCAVRRSCVEQATCLSVRMFWKY